METIKQAAVLVGGVTKLADLLGVSQQSVHAWKSGKSQVSARHAAAIEAVTGGQVTALAIGRECAEHVPQKAAA